MWPTIIIAAVIAAVFVFIVVRGIRNKKQHKGGCSCGCDACPGHAYCHPDGTKKK